MIKKFNILFKGLIFFIASIITVFLFPESNSFSYEFQKGEPWKHENLIAEYDFPLFKSDEEISKEKDFIIKNQKPYFSINKDIEKEIIKIFNDDYDVIINDALTKIDENKRLRYKKDFNFFKTKTLLKLKKIYKTGIVEPLSISKKDAEEIFILEDNEAKSAIYSNLYSQKKAYKELVNFYSKLITENSTELANIDFAKYIKYNVLFEKEITKEFKIQALNEISPVRGMVQAGERIISQGQLINDEKFQIISSLKKQYLSERDSETTSIILFGGHLILSVAIFAILFFYLLFYNEKIFYNNRKLIFFPFFTVLIIIFAAAISKFNFLDIYLVPVTILPLITATFYKPRTAFLHHIITIMLVAYIAANSFEYVFIQFVVGFVAISGVSRLNRRSQVLWTALLIFVTYFLIYSAISIIQDGSFEKIDFAKFGWFAGSSALVLASYPLIYFFERIFGFLSDLTLIELSDTNRPLLKKLAEKAPGSFQHTIQVANISEEAAREIGANPLLVRAGAMYHDIGKMENPSFFIENQHSDNPHDKLKPLKSVEIIKKHVADGLKLAKKNGLPKEVIDFISSHHAKAKIAWFLHKYKENNKDKDIDEEKFKHFGILPNSKETAIVMIVDSIEAASRSLPEYTEESIDNLVEKIVAGKIADNLLDEANITFSEINKVKKILKTKLKNIYHTRVVYPE